MPSYELAGYSLFDYESGLAAREYESLREYADQRSEAIASTLIRRATYFNAVDGEMTEQAAIEQLHHRERGSRPNRQATRYLVHGLHEYKGKFNPQMARSLINTIDPEATSLLDPFCGSGTTLVEGMRLGLHVAGIDQNPLAAWISQVKVEAQRLAGQKGLVDAFDDVADRMRSAMKDGQDGNEPLLPSHVSADEVAYLHRWFPEPVLAALWGALGVSRSVDNPVARIAQVCLSNIVREVSWQLPEDLRVRRRPSAWEPPSVAEVFAASAERGRLALREIEQAAGVSDDIRADVLTGSSRDADTVARAWAPGRHIVVTSPPYATALPYIDTDRLSIVLLGLAPAAEIRQLEQRLTGSREWNTREANAWESQRRENANFLPHRIMDLLSRIEDINESTGAGFRRAAVPNLLYRYFAQMGETLKALNMSMNPGERVVMVVGANRTGSGKHQTAIDTPELIGQIATTRGFEFTELISLETWARYGMHSRNAVNSEKAVVLTVAA